MFPCHLVTKSEYCCKRLSLYGVGSSDFPRSLCFMWFWFGLETLRLVYKKAFFKILNGFSLIWPFNFQKNSTVHYTVRVEKNFYKIGRKGYQKKQNFALISKMSRNLASRSSQRFFLRKTIFCKIFQVPKNLVFQKKIFSLLPNSRLLHIFWISAKFRFFWYPVRPISKNFF